MSGTSAAENLAQPSQMMTLQYKSAFWTQRMDICRVLDDGHRSNRKIEICDLNGPHQCRRSLCIAGSDADIPLFAKMYEFPNFASQDYGILLCKITEFVHFSMHRATCLPHQPILIQLLHADTGEAHYHTISAI